MNTYICTLKLKLNFIEEKQFSNTYTYLYLYSEEAQVL